MYCSIHLHFIRTNFFRSLYLLSRLTQCNLQGLAGLTFSEGQGKNSCWRQCNIPFWNFRFSQRDEETDIEGYTMRAVRLIARCYEIEKNTGMCIYFIYINP